MTNPYDLRRDACGWTVFDRWTGRPVVLCGAVQSGMSLIAADDLVERLRCERSAGDRSILQ